MDPDSKPKGPKDKKGVGTCEQSVAGGRLLEAMGTCGTHATLLDKVRNFGEERRYDARNVLAGCEVKRSCFEHSGGEFAHEGTRLEMEIAEHDVRAPATNKLNYAGVDASTEERHGATSSTRACGDVFGVEPELRS
jgi:hypothetical protein